MKMDIHMPIYYAIIYRLCIGNNKLNCDCSKILKRKLDNIITGKQDICSANMSMNITVYYLMRLRSDVKCGGHINVEQCIKDNIFHYMYHIFFYFYFFCYFYLVESFHPIQELR